MSNIAGKLLVASRTLRDPNFSRTVVLMLEHSHDGALGVVLNRPSPKTVSDVWESIGEGSLENEQPVYLGGPVPGPLIALHAVPNLGEKWVLDGVHMSVQREAIKQLVHTPDTRLRLYSGHSGWGGGQLEQELSAGGWHTVSASRQDVFAEAADSDLLWEQVIQRIAIGIMLPGVRPDELPPDPTMN